MQVIDPGHSYSLDDLHPEVGPRQILYFIKKQSKADGSSEMETVQNGTTNEEVLAVLVDRLKYLGNKLPSRENSIAITKCEEALMWLNKRTAERKARNVEGTMKP